MGMEAPDPKEGAAPVHQPDDAQELPLEVPGPTTMDVQEGVKESTP